MDLLPSAPRQWTTDKHKLLMGGEGRGSGEEAEACLPPFPSPSPSAPLRPRRPLAFYGTHSSVRPSVRLGDFAPPRPPFIGQRRPTKAPCLYGEKEGFLADCCCLLALTEVFYVLLVLLLLLMRVVVLNNSPKRRNGRRGGMAHIFAPLLSQEALCLSSELATDRMRRKLLGEREWSSVDPGFRPPSSMPPLTLAPRPIVVIISSDPEGKKQGMDGAERRENGCGGEGHGIEQQQRGEAAEFWQKERFWRSVTDKNSSPYEPS
ncbi:hypothetical protein niasHT_034743 [Heterodera trifolii]|uniref:Uncharacterized protein n=1 Tax=Heterodera trifolii TaxID=157864 RepID=A0ABD2I459_9BILA